FFQSVINNNGGGHITGNATIMAALTGDLMADGGIIADIADTGFDSNGNFTMGGQIGGNATVSLHAQNITTTSAASGTPGLDLLALEASIYTNAGGTVGGNALVDVVASQNISATG